MRERDLGRSRESRSRMCWQVSETAASLSAPLSLSKPPLCLLSNLSPPPILSFSHLILVVSSSPLSPLSPPQPLSPFPSFVFLYSLSPLIFCPSHPYIVPPLSIPCVFNSYEHKCPSLGVQLKKNNNNNNSRSLLSSALKSETMSASMCNHRVRPADSSASCS